ncbi:MAG: glutamate dehydrogenase, partial [Deltaproteobacteria bacterium]
MTEILKMVRDRDPGENEFHQAVQNVIRSVQPVLERNPEYRRKAVLERITEPERVISFRVPWMDDQAQIR